MDLGGTVAVAGAVAVLVGAFNGWAGWRLAKRAQVTAERREEEIREAPYLRELQDWSRGLLEEEAKRRAQDRLEFNERVARERADCDRRVARAEAEHERNLRDQEVQLGAKVLVLQRTVAAWRRYAEGEGERPP